MNRPHLPAGFKSRWLIALAVVAVLVGAYAWAGYQFAPRWIRSTAIEQVQQRYGRTLAIGEVKVDPFRLTLSIRDLALPDVDGHLASRDGDADWVTVRGLQHLEGQAHDGPALPHHRSQAGCQAPDPHRPPEGTSRAETRLLRERATETFLEQQARELAAAVPEDALAKLGEARAEAVQKALLAAGGLAAERVFPVREGTVTANEGKVRLQLDLK